MYSSELSHRSVLTTTGTDAPKTETVTTSPWVGLRVTCPTPQLTAVHVAGELDTVTTPRLAALLWPRVQCAQAGLVLDLREVTFLGVAGLELLDAVRSYILHRGNTLVLVNSNRTVERALAAGGLDVIVPCYPSIDAARLALLLPTETLLPQEKV